MGRRDAGDDATERARLERIAYGPDSDPHEAARARVALSDLRRGASAGAAVTTGDASRHPDAREARVTPATSAEFTNPAPGPAPRWSALGPTTASSVSDPSSGWPDEPRGEAGTPVDTDPSLQPERASWLRRIADLRRPGVVVGIGLLALVAVAFGGGIAVGQIHPTAGAPSVASAKDRADGEITLEEFLAARQTFADQLPGSVRAPVRLHSTRLVFTNRSLSADDSQTPWDVYAAVGTDTSLVCLIASADGLTATETCAPREVALHGTMSLIAQANSGTLTIRVVSGIVTGSVTPPS